jgi:hypothetical protein
MEIKTKKATKKEETKKCIFQQSPSYVMKRLLACLHHGLSVGVPGVPVVLVQLVGTSSDNSINHSALTL